MFRASPVHRSEASLVKLILIGAVDPARIGSVLHTFFDNILGRVIAFLPLITCARRTSVKVGLGVTSKSYGNFFVRRGGPGHDIINSGNAIQSSGITSTYKITQQVKQLVPILALTVDLETARLIERWRTI